jgi:hypothetical protein
MPINVKKILIKEIRREMRSDRLEGEKDNIDNKNISSGNQILLWDKLLQ